MAVHQIHIKGEAFEPRTLNVKIGDQIHFQLSGRDEAVKVQVAKGERLDGEAEFVVDKLGTKKTLLDVTVGKTYWFSTQQAISKGELKAHEQTGTMNGSITVIP